METQRIRGYWHFLIFMFKQAGRLPRTTILRGQVRVARLCELAVGHLLAAGVFRRHESQVGGEGGSKVAPFLKRPKS